MGASDGKGDLGTSSSMAEKLSNGVPMEIDDDLMGSSEINNLNKEFLRTFCKKVAVSFFNEYGLIQHQINSFNDFIKNGIQRVFDSFGEITVEPGYDPSRRGEGDWRYASVRFGKVTLERPKVWAGESSDGKEVLNFLPRHARLQNMTYSSRMKVQVHFQVSICDAF